MNPPKQGYGNGILKFPLDLSKVEDYFIPANGVFLDNVSPLPLHGCLLSLPVIPLGHAKGMLAGIKLRTIRGNVCMHPQHPGRDWIEIEKNHCSSVKLPVLDIGKVCSSLPGCHVLPEEIAAAVQNDLDLGASGAIIMADKQLVITGGKQGPIYLAKANNLGGYDPAANNTNAFEVTPSLSTAHDVISIRDLIDEGAPTTQAFWGHPQSQHRCRCSLCHKIREVQVRRSRC